MPLPDERPRQSVANLIGKFETQSKHLSPSQSNPSRSSSVVSQATSDLTKEETKEKREWPPKPMVEKTAPGPYHVMPLRINPDATNQPAVQTEAEAPATLPFKQQQAQKEPETFLENWRKGLPQPTEMEPEPTTPKPADGPPASPAPVQKVVSAPQPPKTPTMKTSSSRIPGSTSSRSVGASAKATPKSAWKSTPPKQPLTPATSAQPLKPQLTGQSMVSSTSRRTISKTSTVSKTPTRAETGTKTPTLTPRSKTPSSGLFAPTAASLAKARNTPLPPPPSIKKTAISSDAMDRLSRPTAASLSRVKSGPTSPALTPKSPPRISSAKSKSTISPSKSPQIKVKKYTAVPQGAGGPPVATTVAGAGSALVVVEPDPEEPPELTTNGHLVNEVTLIDVSTLSEVEETHPDTPAMSGNTVEPEVYNEGAAPSQTSETPEAGPEVHNPTNGVEGQEAATKTSLEDIVYLLETAPAARPSTEEISEIPDEDEDDDSKF